MIESVETGAAGRFSGYPRWATPLLSLRGTHMQTAVSVRRKRSRHLAYIAGDLADILQGAVHQPLHMNR